MKKKRIRIFIYFLISVFALGLYLYWQIWGKSNLNSSPPILMQTNDQTKPQNDSACSLPCWEGIRPGQNADIALSILRDDPKVLNIAVYEHQNIKIGDVEWEREIDSRNYNRRLFFYLSKGKYGDIYAIWPEIQCCENLDGYINNFGEPEYVLILMSDFNGQKQISTYSLIWISKGFLVSGFPENETIINKDFKINTIVLFQPSWEGFIEFQGNSGKNAKPWHGFDDAMNYIP